MEYKDSVMMITGGAIRVGRQHALHLAGKGARVSFTYLPGEPWKEAQAEIEALGVQCLATQMDVRDSSAIRRWVATTLDAFGRIDILINNASPFIYKPFLELTEAEWDLSVDVNVKGVFLCSQAVAPIMLRQGQGVIINVTDLSVYQVWPGYAHHAVGKAGVVQLTRYLAAELGPAIRVNAIAPGPILLPDNFTPEQRQSAVERTLLKRLGSPLDAARLVAFLIESDYLTGGIYFVDGGSSLI